MDTFNITAAATKVLVALKEHPEMRDNDRLLVKHIWSHETRAEHTGDFLHEFISGKLSHFESIRRMRQKLQEKYPDLRGERYKIRHAIDPDVVEQLRAF